MIVIFKIIGAAAGAANLLKEFKMPDWNETTDINNKKGKVMRHKVVANSIFWGSPTKPGARMLMTQGIKNSTISTKIPTKNARTEIAEDAKIKAFLRFSAVNFCESIGTNAVVKAPSAKSERNRLGSLKATKKASAAIPAPKKLAKTISRRNPVKRDNNVKPPNVAMALNKFIF